MSRAIGIAGWCVIALLGALHAAAFAGVRLNLSPSVPLGLYWTDSSTTPAVGDYVALCPPRNALFEEALEHGYLAPGACRTGYGELIKVLAATEGSSVATGEDGVWIDGVLWPLSTPRTRDVDGRAIPQRPMPRIEVLDHQSIWVMSERCASGFDARYFGSLSRDALVARATPLFTW
jgi:conjugative transfer signal peptidase TraF